MTIPSNNPFMEFHKLVKKHPKRYSPEIRQYVEIQKTMLKLYDFHLDKGLHVIDWIEKFCIFPQGESAGQKVKLLLWQKWFICSIFCFWGTLSVMQFDLSGNPIGEAKKYLRIVNDILKVIATGNGKTTFMGLINTYLLYSKDFPAANIFIGSNAQKQSNLCYDATYEIIMKSKALKRYARLTRSSHEIRVPQNNSYLLSMSSDGKNFEGIIPVVIMIDEIHAMTTSQYADDLRKSVKRDDSFIFECTTMGTVRSGYLDQRLDYARSVLKGEIINHRFFPCIFAQENEDEVLKAYELGDTEVFLKSNPSFGYAVSGTLLLDKIKKMKEDPKERVTTLTKNFNIPQNSYACYFSESECRTKTFDEDIFKGAPVFMGLDMAYTRNPENDIACLSMGTFNPITEESYRKDFYFLPRYWDYQYRVESTDEIVTERRNMIKAKSKYDANILYDEVGERYGYQQYADKGHVVIVDEELVDMLASLYGEDVRNSIDCTGITQNLIMYYCAYLEKQYGFHLCKFGLDPNKATEVRSFVDANIKSQDGLPPALPFMMDRTKISNAIMAQEKDARKRGLVYCNNKLSELHFANATAKFKADGSVTLLNSETHRKDGVIAQLSSRSAYHVFTTNSKTGEQNKERLVKWWARKAKKKE